MGKKNKKLKVNIITDGSMPDDEIKIGSLRYKLVELQTMPEEEKDRIVEKLSKLKSFTYKKKYGSFTYQVKLTWVSPYVDTPQVDSWAVDGWTQTDLDLLFQGVVDAVQEGYLQTKKSAKYEKKIKKASDRLLAVQETYGDDVFSELVNRIWDRDDDDFWSDLLGF